MDERTQLLSESSSQTLLSETTTLQSTKFSYLHESLSLIAATAPISLSFAMQNIVQACSIMIAGKLGTFELGLASYGYMFATCTGSMVAIGGSTALDTLCGQSFDPETPTKNSQILGVYLRRGILVLSLLSVVVIAPIWWFSEHLFVALGQDEEFARATGRFLNIMIPGGLLQVISECMKKFLQVQRHSNAVGWITTTTSVIGVLANALLVPASLGLWGAPVACVVYNFSNVSVLTVYVWSHPSLTPNLGSITGETFKDLMPFSILAVTGILTVATEWWSFEILAMMAAAFDEPSIGAQSVSLATSLCPHPADRSLTIQPQILMTSDLIFTTISLGLGVQLATESPPSLAATTQGTQNSPMASKNIYGYLFSSNKEIVALTAQVLPLMAGFQVLDLANGGAGDVLRGAGKNHISGMCNFVAYYGVGLTSAWFLGFRLEMGLVGLWGGIIMGSFVLLGLQVGFVGRIDWEKEGRRIVERCGDI
ncbi:uncharacterized protein PAC_15116 [Phialocephala subalpina]|uniref:Ethionine resistance protein n=1 Tax=Phialocephala subalpina TaxID=576137 RepID=A0A1L7XJU8_9HELO|nr:uncharacterized protein PAC_15116 [Phialocephala subalpina]